MNKYEKAQIYKIVDTGYNKCYFGSTCESLSQRMARHRHNYSSYQRKKHKYVYSFQLFDEFGLDNCKIELIENFPCKSVEELHRREGYYIRKFDCVNKVIAGRTDEQYREDNREHILMKKRERYEINRGTLNQQSKDYYHTHKDKINERIECPYCKCQVRRSYIPIHNLSKVHIKNELKVRCQTN